MGATSSEKVGAGEADTAVAARMPRVAIEIAFMRRRIA
jgi:hypothetical protein